MKINACILCILIFSSFSSLAQNILRGTIVQQENRNIPIRKASVYILGVDKTTTDDNGNFALDLNKCNICTPGTPIDIKVNSDHGVREYAYNVPNNNALRAIEISIPSNNKLIISGIIRDKVTGDFIKGIVVKIKIPGFDVNSIKTDAFGSFNFELEKDGIGDNQAVTVLMLDVDKGKYKDKEQIIYVSKTPEPKTIFLEEDTNYGYHKSLEVGSDMKSNISVKKGQRVSISANGVMTVGFFVGTSPPNGLPTGVAGMSLRDWNCNGVFKDWNHAVLCYRIAPYGEWKYYDSSSNNEFTAQESGYIEFKINDRKQSDNSGYYNVEVIIKR